MRNTALRYAYVTGGGTRRFGTFVVEGAPDEGLTARLFETLDYTFGDAAAREDGQFVAAQVGLPDLFPFRVDPDPVASAPIPGEDHGWHTLLEAAPVESEPSAAGLTLETVVRRFEAAAAVGWATEELLPSYRAFLRGLGMEASRV